MDTPYQSRVAEQIRQYAEGPQDTFSLPPIYYLWSSRYVAPGMKEVFGCVSIEDFFLKAFPAGGHRILSLGCGDGALEIKLAKRLIALGKSAFTIVGIELSPILLKRFRDQIEQECLAAYFHLVEGDLNQSVENGAVDGFDMIMANHSLHHIVDLESVFSYCQATLRPNCTFAINDMIGRNGHMRWPEALPFIDAFWPLLSEQQRRSAASGRSSETFEDHDCSKSGFEGIRAQDILPLLLKSFHPERFLGFGGMIDVFVDRCYGRNFDAKSPDDVRLVQAAASINEALLDAGLIKPTMMLAYFRKEPCVEVCYRGRSAARSVRTP